jgi:hypothetical protein
MLKKKIISKILSRQLVVLVVKVLYFTVKVPSHQIRSAQKWSVWKGFHVYKNHGW